MSLLLPAGVPVSCYLFPLLLSLTVLCKVEAIYFQLTIKKRRLINTQHYLNRKCFYALVKANGLVKCIPISPLTFAALLAFKKLHMLKENLNWAYKHEDACGKGSDFGWKNFKFILLTLLKLERGSFGRSINVSSCFIWS